MPAPDGMKMLESVEDLQANKQLGLDVHSLLPTREVVLYIPAFVPSNMDCACHRKQGNPPPLCGFWSECFNTTTGMRLDHSPSLRQVFDSVAAEGPCFAD